MSHHRLNTFILNTNLETLLHLRCLLVLTCSDVAPWWNILFSVSAYVILRCNKPLETPSLKTFAWQCFVHNPSLLLV